jgi:carbamoyl-phosphate synthase large subunit
LNRAIEVDVDAISDGKQTFVGGVMEHIEEAGIHSGDSTCSIPVASLPLSVTERIRTYARELARRLRVIGLMNLQFAVQNDRIYLLEINPRASRTVPFVSKATGYALAKLAVQVMMGRSLHDLGIHHDLDQGMTTFNLKAPVFPFHKFPNVDIILGPEMKSTGEVMGRAKTFPEAYAKALLAAGMAVPPKGRAFLSIRNEDKAEILPIAMGLKDMGFELWATHGTAEFLNHYEIKAEPINKVAEGSPHCVEAIREGRFDLVINTTSDERAIRDSFSIRRAALEKRIPYSTVIASARAMVDAIRARRKGPFEVLHL